MCVKTREVPLAYIPSFVHPFIHLRNLHSRPLEVAMRMGVVQMRGKVLKKDCHPRPCCGRHGFRLLLIA